MAQLPNVFKASEHEKMSSNFEPLPAGWYLAEIVKSEILETKAKNGNKYIKLRFKIIDGKFENRLVFNNLNIINSNSIAEEIAKKELATISEICEEDEIDDTDQLHNIPMGIRLTIREATASYPASNEIKEYCSEADFSSKDSASNPF